MSATIQRRPGLLSRLAAIEDGSIMRVAFFALLAGTLGVLYVDFNELMASDADSAMMAPILPVLPAFDPDNPMAPGPEVTTDRALLEAPLAIALKGGGVLELTGTMDVGSAQRVAAEVQARGEYIKIVALNSPGGAVDDAMEIGRVLREQGYATTVASGALCASSCPLVLAAGAERTAEPGAAIGVHQVYATLPADQLPVGMRGAGFGMSEAQKTTATITRYLAEMGIDPALWLHALETPPASLYYLSPEELVEYRLVTPAPGGENAATPV